MSKHVRMRTDVDTSEVQCMVEWMDNPHAVDVEVHQHQLLHQGNQDAPDGLQYYLTGTAPLGDGRIVLFLTRGQGYAVTYQTQVVTTTATTWQAGATSNLGSQDGSTFVRSGVTWREVSFGACNAGTGRILLLGETATTEQPELSLLSYSGDTVSVLDSLVIPPGVSLTWYRFRMYPLNDGTFLILGYPASTSGSSPMPAFRVAVTGDTITQQASASIDGGQRFADHHRVRPLIFEDAVMLLTSDPANSSRATVWPIAISGLTLGTPQALGPEGLFSRAAMAGVVTAPGEAIVGAYLYRADWSRVYRLYSLTWDGQLTFTELPAEDWPSNVEWNGGGTGAWVDPRRTGQHNKLVFHGVGEAMVKIDDTTLAFVAKIGDGSWDDNEIGVFLWDLTSNTQRGWALLKGEQGRNTNDGTLLFEDSLSMQTQLTAEGTLMVGLVEYYDDAGSQPNYASSIYLSLLLGVTAEMGGGLIGTRRRFS